MKKALSILAIIICLISATSVVFATGEEESSNTHALQASNFDVRFFDVGQGDSAIVTCDGRSMLIDGGDPSASSILFSFLKTNQINQLDYIVCTHPQTDHAAGLSGAMNYANVNQIMSSVATSDNAAFKDLMRFAEQKGTSVMVPGAGSVFYLGSAKGTILGPVTMNGGENDNSLVVRLEYGDISFLFMGDAGTEEEREILAQNKHLKSTVLKVGHHGSNTSTSESFLKAVAPEYAIISCGTANDYGHPTDATLDALKRENVQLYRTDLQGDISCHSDGKSVVFEVEKGADEDTYQTYHDLNPGPVTRSMPTVVDSDATVEKESEELSYVLNTNTKKFHYPDCRGVKQMKDKNKQNYTGTREELIQMGYDPCGMCHP